MSIDSELHIVALAEQREINLKLQSRAIQFLWSEINTTDLNKFPGYEMVISEHPYLFVLQIASRNESKLKNVSLDC